MSPEEKISYLEGKVAALELAFETFVKGQLFAEGRRNFANSLYGLSIRATIPEVPPEARDGLVETLKHLSSQLLGDKKS